MKKISPSESRDPEKRSHHPLIMVKNKNAVLFIRRNITQAVFINFWKEFYDQIKSRKGGGE